MRKLIFFLILLPGVLQAQEQSALYKIEGNGLTEPSYLFGTINFLPQFGYFLPNEVKLAIEQSEVYVNKLSLKRKVQRQFNEAVKIPNEGSISAYLNTEEEEQLKSIIEKYGGKNQAYQNFYSHLQPVILVTSVTALTLQNNVTYPERELEDIAKSNKLKFVSLSNVNEEINAFQQFPIEEQAKSLSYMVTDFKQHIKDYKRLVRSYHKEQNLEEVERITLKATNNNQAFKNAYYDDRTKNWLPQIEKLINSKSSFIALGVPHLVGDEGAIKLLLDKGYTVTPVAIDFVPAKTSN